MENKPATANTNPVNSEALTYDQWKNDFLRIVLRITTGIFVIIIIIASSSNNLPTNILYFIMAAIIAFMAFAPVSYPIRAFGLLATLFIAATNLLLIWGIEGEASMLYLAIIILSTLLYEKRNEFIVLGLTTATILTVAALSVNGQHILIGWSGLGDQFYSIMVATWIDWIVYLVDVIAVGFILIYAIRLLKGKFNTILEEAKSSYYDLTNARNRVLDHTEELVIANQRNEHRTTQFEAIARIARTTSSIQTLSELLPQIAQTISEQFGFYHVGIFLLDSKKEYAILAAANSEGGKIMLKRNHRLLVGGTGIVGFVTNTGQPRIALDVGLDTVYFNNPDLPDTHSEIALPLRIGANIFGALDVQSTETNAFSEEDVSILSILADQVGIAIQNARSYQQIQEALAQAEAASTQMSDQQWKQFLTHESAEGYYFDGVDTKIMKPSDKQRAHSLAVPLILRGTRIGTIKLSTADPNRTWTSDEIDMAQATAERTSIALENARLLQESQKRAAKERVIGEISARIGSSSNLESILHTAIQELGNTLPGTDIAIQFKQNRETE